MKTKMSKSLPKIRRNIIILIITVIVVAGFLICGVFLYNQYRKDRDNATTNPGDTQSQDQNNSKTPSKPSSGLPDNTTTTTPDQIPTSTELSVSITNVSQLDGTVRASTQTSGNGTCVFLFKPGDGGKPVTRQVEIANNICSINISQDEFAYLGQWNLDVTYYNGNNKAEASQDVTIH